MAKVQPRGPSRGSRFARARTAGDRYFLGLSTGRAVILAVAISALALTLAVPLRTYFSQDAEAAQLAVDHRQLAAEVRALREKKAQQQDPAYIRAQARSRLRLVDPGETPYIVQLPGAFEASRAVDVPTTGPTGPWYSKLWESVSRPVTPPSATPMPVPVAPTGPVAPPGQLGTGASG